jgi:hypothetical protein
MITLDQNIDINKLIVEFLDKNIERLARIGYDVFKEAKNSIKIRIRSTYENYLKNLTLRYAKTKSFFFRDEPVFIENFYVPLKLIFNKQTIGTATTKNILSKSNYVIITGLAGCGKSIIMKYLVSDILKNTQLLPVFLELRELNNRKNDITDFIEETLVNFKLSLDENYFHRAFQEGHFVFLLDGFDEIDYDSRENIKSSLYKFINLYPECKIIISSRPDSEFGGWKEFIRMYVKELDINQACELLEKVPYDEAIKKKFIYDLKQNLFNKHKSFLSNPLLLSIMLLTYGQSADIPNKLNVFYNQAYEALYQRHDALKGGFKRKRYTNLDIQDYAKVFSSFCVQMYERRRFTFYRTEVVDALSKAKIITNIEFNTTHYLNDLLQSTCLLIEDGLTLTHAHRSFQEYFTAKFINEMKPEIQKRLLDKLYRHLESDSVFELLFEMNQEMLEKQFILPNLETIFKESGIKKMVGIIQFSKFIKLIYRKFEVVDDEVHGIESDLSIEYGLNKLIHFLFKKYDYHQKLVNNYEKRVKGSDLKGFKNQSFDTAKLNSKSDFMNYLCNSGGYFSKEELEFLLEINNDILKRHKKTDLSIEEIILNR